MSLSDLDDRDPAFVYTGFWGQMSVEGLEFAGTSTWTNLSLSTAVISFTGVQITVFGTIAPIGDGAAPTTVYSLDNLPTKQSYTAVQQSQAQYRQQFFQSEILSSGAHTLEIQYQANEGQFILDYVQVQAAQGNSNQAPTIGTTLTQTTTTTATLAPTVSTKATDSTSDSSTASTSESSTTPTSATGSTTQFSTKPGQTGLTTSTTPPGESSGTAQATSTAPGLVTTPTGSSSSPTSPAASLSERRTHNTMPIVGGVVGGIVLIGIVIIGAIIWRKKRNRVKTLPTTLPVTSETVTPFHPQALLADNMTGSTYFVSSESKSTAQLLSLPPPAYE
ncbi:hypothetical protein HYPSUDRAFT_220245 [Hypholoma sublateritium FD-334 SS-4]|uniref:Uncharacterized protein n=1 Tax=Hypholoma sublateritium (strain FD-334 SS-4) TaxID=945553 RepID=A0A0D2P2Y2_HYPSF|nr:hypothetical protein HYPSUDRAFT_220245 [Hypholoma sublateritium FD-334 SS-4]